MLPIIHGGSGGWQKCLKQNQLHNKDSPGEQNTTKHIHNRVNFHFPLDLMERMAQTGHSAGFGGADALNAKG